MLHRNMVTLYHQVYGCWCPDVTGAMSPAIAIVLHIFHHSASPTIMMTSPNGNIFHVTGPFWGEFPGHRWVPLTQVSNAERWCFLWSASEQKVEQTHWWSSTQPGTCTQPCPIVHTAVLPLFTQPCPGRTMSTAVCIYVARLCASCPAV